MRRIAALIVLAAMAFSLLGTATPAQARSWMIDHHRKKHKRVKRVRVVRRRTYVPVYTRPSAYYYTRRRRRYRRGVVVVPSTVVRSHRAHPIHPLNRGLIHSELKGRNSEHGREHGGGGDHGKGHAEGHGNGHGGGGGEHGNGKGKGKG